MSNGTPVICVDLSKYQKGFDFTKYKGYGGLGVICKATEGTSIQDSCYTDFRQKAKAAGLKFASYHFFRPSDPTAQADYYFNFARPEEGERMVCDFEDDSTSIDNMVTFLKRLQSKGKNVQLTIYSGHTIKDKLGSKTNDWLAENTSLWLAQYTTGTITWPKQVWPQWSLWQYSDKNTVPGFSGAVDTNRFNGPDTQFLAWMGPAGAAPAPPPEPTPEPDTIANVTIKVTSDKPVNIYFDLTDPNINILNEEITEIIEEE